MGGSRQAGSVIRPIVNASQIELLDGSSMAIRIPSFLTSPGALNSGFLHMQSILRGHKDSAESWLAKWQPQSFKGQVGYCPIRVKGIGCGGRMPPTEITGTTCRVGESTREQEGGIRGRWVCNRGCEGGDRVFQIPKTAIPHW